MRKGMLTIACVVGLSFGGGMTVRASDWTLIVTPVRYSVVQVLFDILRMRPVVLVSYQAPVGQPEPSLHAWNNQEWIPITLRDLAEVRFLQVLPRRVILLGDPSTLPPAVLQSTAWCKEIIQVSELDTPSLVNALGRLFRFDPEEWAWIAARYRLAVEDANEPLRARSWYRDPSAAPPRPRIPLFRRHRPTGAQAAPVWADAPDSPKTELHSTAAAMPIAEPTPLPAEPLTDTPEEGFPTPVAAEPQPGPGPGPEADNIK